MARILQHECDHLAGTVYIDRCYTRTFRRVDLMGQPGPEPHAEFGTTPAPGAIAAKGFAPGASSSATSPSPADGTTQGLGAAAAVASSRGARGSKANQKRSGR